MPFPKFIPSFTTTVPMPEVHQHCIRLLLLPKFALLLVSLATTITESKLASSFLCSASAIVAGVLVPVVELDLCIEEVVVGDAAVHSTSFDLKFMILDSTAFVAPFVGPDCSFIPLHWMSTAPPCMSDSPLFRAKQ